MHIQSQFVQLWGAVQKRLRNRRFWHDSGLLMLAYMIVLALGMVRTPAMTWLLPKEQMGMIGVVAAWLPFLQLLSLSGLDGASYHYVAKGQPWAFIVNLKHRLRWSLLSAIGFLIGAAYWWWQGELPLAWMFVIAGVSYPVTVGLSACGGTLSAQEKFVGLFGYRLGESITDFVGFVPILLSVWLVNQVVTFYGANQIATAVMMVGVALLIRQRLRKVNTDTMSSADETEMVRYGKHLTAMNGIGVIQNRTDSLLVGTFLPLTVVADYAIALLIYEQLNRLWAVYVPLRYPPFVRLSILRRRRRMVLEGGVVLTGFSLLGVVASLFVHWLVPIILPQEYISSIRYIDWLIFIFVVGVPGFMAEMYFRTRQDEKRQYWLRGISAVVGSGLAIVGMQLWGVFGILLSRLITNLLFSFTGLILFWQDGMIKTQ